MRRYGLLFLFLFVVTGLVTPIVGQDEGKLVGTWCSQCGRMIPAGETCPHMQGGSSSSNKGDSSSSSSGESDPIWKIFKWIFGNNNSGKPIQTMEDRGAELNSKAVDLFNQGDFEGALKVFHKASRMSPKDDTIRMNIAVTLNKLGTQAFEDGDFRLALKRFHDALDYAPDDENILKNIYVTLDRMNKKTTPRQPIPGTPNDEHPYTVWGDNGQFHPAAGYRWMDPNDPNDFRVELIPVPGTPNNEYPNTMAAENGTVLPAPGYTWANPNDPNDLRVKPKVTVKDDERHNSLGTQLIEQKNYLDAEVEFRKAMELAPDNPTYAKNLGICLQAQFNPIAEERIKISDYPGAADAYQRLLLELPVNYAEGRAECHTLLGATLSHIKGKEAEAYANLKAGAELNPLSAANSRALGEFLMSRGMNAEAAAAFQKSMELDGNVEVNWLLNLTKARAEREMRAAEKYGISSLNNSNISNIKRGSSIVFDESGRGTGSDTAGVDFSKMDQPIQWPEKFKNDSKFIEMQKELAKRSTTEKELEKEFQQVQQKRVSAEGSNRAQLAVQEAELKAKLFQAEFERKTQEKRMKKYVVENI